MGKCQWCGRETGSFLGSYCSKKCRSEADGSRKPDGPITKFIKKVILWCVVVFFGFCALVGICSKEDDTAKESVAHEEAPAVTVPKQAAPPKAAVVDCPETVGEDLLRHARAGDLEGVKRVLGNCPDRVNYQDADGVTPIMAATRSGNAALVKLLISNKASTSLKDAVGRMVLDYAGKKDEEIVNLLINSPQ